MQTRQEKSWTDATVETENARSASVANGGMGGDAGKDMSFSDTLYAKIEEVIGGDNPNQFLCLTIPGQALAAADYSYDYEKGVKGRNVEARESKLANKQLDACRMTGGDSGLTLPNQYKSALNMLVPKLNGKVMEAKNDLRHLLMTPYPYRFEGEAEGTTHSLQEVYFRLYDELIAQKEQWAQVQNAKQQELGDGTDAYLQWYETVAEGYLTAIEEKLSKVISVCSTEDMKVLEGVLDSGSGAELEEARQTLTNAGKLTPDGGYVYPVKLSPTNWFELLDTSFTPADLLDDPDVISQKLKGLSQRRLDLSAQIEELSALVPDDSELAALKNEVDTARNTLSSAENSLITTYGNGIQTVISTALDLASLFQGGVVPAKILSGLVGDISLPSGKSTEDLIKDLSADLSQAAKAQSDYVEASQKLSEASEKQIAAQNLKSLAAVLSPLKEKLAEADAQIEELRTQISISSAMRPKADADGKVLDTNSGEQAVCSTGVPKGYTRIYLSASASTLDKQTSQQSSSSVTTGGASFLFFGGSGRSEKQSSAFQSLMSSQDVTIEVGMNVAKVGIEREWFNPGVFYLTRDMFNMTTQKVAPSGTFKTMDDRINAMASGNCIFPCYTTAMLIARDISVRFHSATSLSDEFSSTVTQHASSGGGFLFFSGSHSSSQSSSQSSVHAKATDNSVTLRFDTPQIIGYYLECVHADESSYIDDVERDKAAGYVTISEFSSTYRKLLQEFQQTK